jgi:cyclophilin family peptidyl-prolyl cis-trans isomerase
MKNEVHEMVVCELFDDICPKTCKNFKDLCVGFERNSKKLTYVDTEFDRIVPGAYVQGGNLRKTLGKY